MDPKAALCPVRRIFARRGLHRDGITDGPTVVVGKTAQEQVEDSLALPELALAQEVIGHRQQRIPSIGGD